jgi:hypothetical protein
MKTSNPSSEANAHTCFKLAHHKTSRDYLHWPRALVEDILGSSLRKVGEVEVGEQRPRRVDEWPTRSFVKVCAFSKGGDSVK